MPNRLTNQPVFFVVRRLIDPDGAFAGVLLGTIRVAYLEKLFSASALPEGGSIKLSRPDGSLLAQYPPVPYAGDPGRQTELHTWLYLENYGAVRTGGSGAERMMSISDLPTHPLSIMLSVPFSIVIAAWQLQAVWTGGIAIAGCLATVVTLLVAICRFQDRQRREADGVARKFTDERQRAEREMADQHRRFGIALDTMSQGLLMFDRANSLLLANAGVVKIFCLPAGALRTGMKSRTLFKRWAAREICPKIFPPWSTSI